MMKYNNLVIKDEEDVVVVSEIEDAYALLHELVEFIKMKETINEEQS